MSFACQEYGWKIQYVTDEVSLTMLMLLMRQKLFNSVDNGGFTLLQQEKLDNEKDIPWEELVRRNREQMAKSGLYN